MAAAISAIENGRPDVVLLDIGMPDVSGYEVAAWVRNERLNDITLIAITGWGMVADKAMAHEAGFDFHLTKPVEPAEIASLLKTLAR